MGGLPCNDQVVEVSVDHTRKWRAALMIAPNNLSMGGSASSALSFAKDGSSSPLHLLGMF